MMRALMRQMLWRVLLLAVFFNTAVGMPLHAAAHQHGDTTRAAQIGVDLHASKPADSGKLAADEHGAGPAQCSTGS